MRYFKYSDPWPELKAEYDAYTEALCSVEKKLFCLRRLGTPIFWGVFLLTVIGLGILFWGIFPLGEGVAAAIVEAVLFLFGVFAILILGIILGTLAATPFWSAEQKISKIKMQDSMQKATEHLRSFYQLNEPCVVTKCYRCSDRKWDRHDICLFIVEDELRMTTNLKHGFFHPDKDLGCYCLSKQEITWKDGQFRELPALELEADGVIFLLSRNAISIIRGFMEAE